MNEDQTMNNSEVQQRHDQLYRTQENITNAEPESVGQFEYAHAQAEPMSQQGASLCPVCGSVLPQGADYCENCRRYVKNDVCSFCGAPLPRMWQSTGRCRMPRMSHAQRVCLLQEMRIPPYSRCQGAVGISASHSRVHASAGVDQRNVKTRKHRAF